MNSLMIKALGFSVILVLATIFVVTKLHIDIFADSVNAITMGGAIGIAIITSAVSVKYINQMKTDEATGELVEDSWDGIGEMTNELPSGWAYSFLGLFLWSMWYGFFGYPINAYSQIGEYNEEVLAYNKKFEKIHKNATNETLRDMGESIFLVQCQQCHGATGDGLSGKAQDLTRNRTEKEVLDIIKNGQNSLNSFAGGMPAGMAMGQDAKDIAKYIASGFKGKTPASYAVCGSCHGAKGEGIPYAGPQINGYDVLNTLANGKKGKIGEMPTFKTLITPVQEKALTVYLQSFIN